jgi:N-acetylglutamate synthase-like GNAT family acetyltransferase
MVANPHVEAAKILEKLNECDRSQLLEAMKAMEAKKPKAKPGTTTIRSFQPGDVGYVAYLHGKLYHEAYGFGKAFESYVMKGLGEFLVDSDGGDLWVAEVDGEVIGSIAITRYDKKTAKLRWFIIDERYHGCGFGKQLMDTALAFCKEKGFEHVFLGTVSILETARHLYKKYNFSLTEQTPNNTWTDKVIMEERWDLLLSE